MVNVFDDEEAQRRLESSKTRKVDNRVQRRRGSTTEFNNEEGCGRSSARNGSTTRSSSKVYEGIPRS